VSEEAGHTGDEATAVHRLDYGHVAYPTHDASPGKIAIGAPPAFICMLWQLIWAPVVGTFVSFARMGHAKSLLIDAGVYLIPGLPSILALAYFVRGWRSKKRYRFSVLTLLAVAGALAVLFCLCRYWYAEVWCDPGGYWDGP
jgi:hypothetical protein